jgi:uncharacterized delta-60 repeat protein
VRTRVVELALAVLCLAVFAAVAKALAAGDLDPTFSSDGKFIEPLGEGTRPGGSFRAVALQPDGKIVGAGLASNSVALVARVNPDGTLDPTFDSDGKLLHPLGAGANEAMFPAAIALGPNGEIVIAGTVGNFGTQVNQVAVVRLTPEGALDDTLDGDGILVTQLGESGNPDSTVSALHVLADGRILLAGGASNASGTFLPLLARRNANGSPDPSFGGGGKKMIQLGEGASAGSSVSDMKLQPDGKIVVAGAATDTGGMQANAAMVARFDADGQNLDSSFGTGGKYVGRLGTTDYAFTVSGLTLQADGKPVLVGHAYDNSQNFPSSEAMVARLNVDGAGVDSGFGTNGTFKSTFEGTNADARLLDVVVQPDGKLVGVGGGEGDGFTVLILRLTSAGALDPSFSGDGRDLTQLGELSSGFAAAALDPAGKIVAAGETLNDVNGNLDAHSLIARYILDVPPTASFTAVGAGRAVAFDGSGSADPDGTIVSHEWDFGDGSTGAGSTARHRYARAGTYTVTLTVRDDYGLTNAAKRAIAVRRPILSRLRIKPARFPAARRGGSIAAARRRGAKVSYIDSQAATTTFTVARVLPGRKRGRRCVKPRPRNRGGKRCTRFARLRGSFRHVDKAGKNSFRFTGRLRRRALRPGRYRLTARPRLKGTAGKRVSVRFRIIR